MLFPLALCPLPTHKKQGIPVAKIATRNYDGQVRAREREGRKLAHRRISSGRMVLSLPDSPHPSLRRGRRRW